VSDPAGVRVADSAPMTLTCADGMMIYGNVMINKVTNLGLGPCNATNPTCNPTQVRWYSWWGGVVLWYWVMQPDRVAIIIAFISDLHVHVSKRLLVNVVPCKLKIRCKVVTIHMAQQVMPSHSVLRKGVWEVREPTQGCKCLIQLLQLRWP
jgi:hypothetical protein